MPVALVASTVEVITVWAKNRYSPTENDLQNKGFLTLKPVIFSDQKLSLMSPEVTWLVPWQESQFLSTSPEVFSVQQTLGWFSKARDQAKEFWKFHPTLGI